MALKSEVNELLIIHYKTNLQMINTIFLLFYFLLCIGAQPINNVVIVSGEQLRDSVIHIHVSILPQTPLPSRLPDNINQNSMCYTVGPRWLSILNTALCTGSPQTPLSIFYPILLLSPATINLFSKSVNLFLFYKFIWLNILILSQSTSNMKQIVVS